MQTKLVTQKPLTFIVASQARVVGRLVNPFAFSDHFRFVTWDFFTSQDDMGAA